MSVFLECFKPLLIGMPWVVNGFGLNLNLLTWPKIISLWAFFNRFGRNFELLHGDRIGLDGIISTAASAFSFHNQNVLFRGGINPTWSRNDAAEMFDTAYALNHIILGVDTTPNSLCRLLSWETLET